MAGCGQQTKKSSTADSKSAGNGRGGRVIEIPGPPPLADPSKAREIRIARGISDEFVMAVAEHRKACGCAGGALGGSGGAGGSDGGSPSPMDRSVHPQMASKYLLPPTETKYALPYPPIDNRLGGSAQMGEGTHSPLVDRHVLPPMQVPSNRLLNPVPIKSHPDVVFLTPELMSEMIDRSREGSILRGQAGLAPDAPKPTLARMVFMDDFGRGVPIERGSVAALSNGVDGRSGTISDASGFPSEFRESAVARTDVVFLDDKLNTIPASVAFADASTPVAESDRPRGDCPPGSDWVRVWGPDGEWHWVCRDYRTGHETWPVPGVASGEGAIGATDGPPTGVACPPGHDWVRTEGPDGFSTQWVCRNRLTGLLVSPVLPVTATPDDPTDEPPQETLKPKCNCRIGFNAGEPPLVVDLTKQDYSSGTFQAKDYVFEVTVHVSGTLNGPVDVYLWPDPKYFLPVKPKKGTCSPGSKVKFDVSVNPGYLQLAADRLRGSDASPPEEVVKAIFQAKAGPAFCETWAELKVVSCSTRDVRNKATTNQMIPDSVLVDSKLEVKLLEDFEVMSELVRAKRHGDDAGELTVGWGSLSAKLWYSTKTEEVGPDCCCTYVKFARIDILGSLHVSARASASVHVWPTLLLKSKMETAELAAKSQLATILANFPQCRGEPGVFAKDCAAGLYTIDIADPSSESNRIVVPATAQQLDLGDFRIPAGHPETPAAPKPPGSQVPAVGEGNSGQSIDDHHPVVVKVRAGLTELLSRPVLQLVGVFPQSITCPHAAFLTAASAAALALARKHRDFMRMIGAIRIAMRRGRNWALSGLIRAHAFRAAIEQMVFITTSFVQQLSRSGLVALIAMLNVTGGIMTFVNCLDAAIEGLGDWVEG